MAVSIFVLGMATMALDPIDVSQDVCDGANNTAVFRNSPVSNDSLATYATASPKEISTNALAVAQTTSLAAKWIAFVCLMLYVCAFAFSFGPG